MTIDDTGKVWLKGSFRPVYAVRVGERIFIPGLEEGQQVDCWVAGAFLWVDLHDPGGAQRLVRRFPLEAPPDTSGTLFSGFDRTKHADIRAVLWSGAAVREVRFEGERYAGVRDLGREEFRKRAEAEMTG